MDNNLYETGLGAARSKQEESEYQDSLERIAKMGAYNALSINPDQDARLQAAAKSVGVPVDSARTFPEDVTKQAKFNDIDFSALVKDTPNTARFFANQNNANIAHDDIAQLSGMEKTLNWWKNNDKAIISGLVFGTSEAIAAYGLEAPSDMLQRYVTKPLADSRVFPFDIGQPVVDLAHSIRKSQTDWKDYLTPKTGNTIEQAWYSGLQSLAQNLGVIPMAVMSGNPEVALGAMSAIAGGQSYAKARDVGIDPLQSLIYSGADSAIEYLTEQTGMNLLFKDIKAGSSLTKTLMHQIVPDQVGEQAATVLQDFNEWAVLHPEKTIQSYLDERPNAALQTAIATTIAGGGNVLIAKAMEGMLPEQDKAKTASMSAMNIERLNEVMKASKTVQRSPDAIHELAKGIVDGSSVQNLYIDGKMFAQSGVANQVADMIPEIRHQISIVLATGGEVKIPLADYVSKIAGTDLAVPLVDHLRVEGDDYTRAEATEFLNRHATELQNQVEQVMLKSNADEAFRTSYDKVKNTITEQLKNGSQYRDDVVEANALLAASWYATQASALRISPEELFAMRPLKIASNESLHGVSLSDSNILHQSKYVDDQLDLWNEGKLKSSVILNLGVPSNILQRFGVSQSSIHLTQAVLKKAVTKHNVSVDELKGLVKAIQAPLAILESKKGSGHMVLLTELAHENGNIVAALEMDANRDNIQINEIRSLHPKDTNKLLGWIKDGLLVGHEKQKGRQWLEHSATSNSLQEQVISALSSSSVYEAIDDDNLLKQSTSDDERIADEHYRVLRRELGSLLPIEQKVFDDFVSTRNDGAELLQRLEEHNGTPWAKAAMEGIFVRQAIKSYASGNTPDFQSMFDHKNAIKVRELVKKKGMDGVHIYLDAAKFIGDAAKPINNVSSSFINCNPSEDCAKYCYATEGHYRYANSVIKSELVSLAIEMDPVRSAKRTAAEYKATAEFANNKALRLFDKGDGSSEWIPYIKKLNDEGIRVQIFSKVPEFLRQVPEVNLRLLSIDKSNMEMANENPDLSVAFVYGGGHEQIDFLARLVTQGQIQVVLPVKQGRKVLSDEQTDALKKAVPGIGKYVCPIDSGIKKIGPNSEPDKWNCTKCDKNGGLGCFFGKVTETVMKSAEVRLLSTKDKAARILELRRQINELTGRNEIAGGNKELAPNAGVSDALANFGSNEQGRIQSLLHQVDDLLGDLLREYEPDAETRNAFQGNDRAESNDNGLQGDQSVTGRRTIPIKQIFDQGSGNRGGFKPDENLIVLLKDADLSTFAHELGHFFLHNQFEIAQILEARGGLSSAEQQLVDDANTLLKWFGVSDLERWHTLALEQQTEAHEKFAEGFERYLFEGKSPSFELQSVFNRFATWMKEVYKKLLNMRVDLTPEVRAVMDRMIASEEQIAMAEKGRSMMPLFTSKEHAEQLGVNITNWDEYQKLGEDATAAAIEAMQTKAVRDLQWVNNAQSKMLKKLQRQHAERRREIRQEVRFEVMAMPVYQAWSFLTRKLTSDDKITSFQKDKSNPDYVDASQDTLFTAIAKLGGLSRESVESEWGVDPAEKNRQPVFGKHVLRRNGGRSIEAMGEVLMEYGYLTPDAHGKFDKHDFEERFYNQLRGVDQYSFAFNSNVFLEESKAGAHIINPSGLMAGRIELIALQNMILPREIEQRIVNLKMTARDGLDPDVVSEIVPGFSSGDELVRAIAEAKPPKELIEELTDQRMLEKFGDLSTEEGINKAAFEAIYNDVRARFVTREANALSEATKEPKSDKRILASAVKEFASNLISKLAIRDIKPGQYSIAEQRAARLSSKASEKGDLRVAAAEKRNQAINLQLTKQSNSALDEVEKMLRYFKRFDSDKPKIEMDYIQQIHGLLNKFDLHGKSLKLIDREKRIKDWVRMRLAEGIIPEISEDLLSPADKAIFNSEVSKRNEQGELVYREDVDQIALLAEFIDNSEKRHYRDATLEELRGLYDNVRHIEALGRLKHKLLTARENLSFDQVKAILANSIAENGGLGGQNVRTQNSNVGKMLETVRRFGAAHIKVASLAYIMDGGKEGGPVWEYLIMPANKASSYESTLRAESTEALDKILRPILKVRSKSDLSAKGISFPKLGTSLNWQERFAVLLNMGNESNMQRLLDGGIVSDKAGIIYLKPSDLIDIVGTLTTDEIRAAQKIWDHFESFRPLIAEKEKRVTGKEPQWIPVRPIDVKSVSGEVVTLRGGYYPVKFDSKVNEQASAHDKAKEADAMKKASYSAATTNRSFIKTRLENVKGRPLLLNLSGLYSGVSDEIHDLAWHEWVIDANRLLKSHEVNGAIREYYGDEVLQEIKKWRDDIIVGTRRLDHQVEKFFGTIRHYVSASSLGFNLVSAALQPIGLTNSIARVGMHWIGIGVGQYLGDMKGTTNFVQSKSEFMKNRNRTRFRELNELRNQVQGQTAAKEMIGKYAYWLMMKTQTMVDVPTWLGAYEKAISEFYDDDVAIHIADQAVKDSQGGGEEVDQSGIERGSPLVKVFTAFYGFMGTTLNTAVMTTSKERERGKIASNLLLTVVAPVVLGTLFKEAMMPGDGDDEPLSEKLIKEEISFLFGLFAGIREFSFLFNPKTSGYQAPVGLRFISDVGNFKEQMMQGEFDDAFRKSFINLIGDTTGAPAVQINRTINGAEAIASGKTQNPAALAFGFR